MEGSLVTMSSPRDRASRLADDADSVPILMLTLEQATAAVNLSEDTLREVMRSGALASVLIGRSRRIRWADLQGWVAGLPQAAA